MKTLRAKGSLLVTLSLTGVFSVFWIPFCVYGILEESEESLRILGIVLTIGSLIFLFSLAVCEGIEPYRTHWIQYGNGKIVIRRVSAICLNGCPVGNYENREDTFLLEEIDSYGLSWQVLGHYVECNRCSGRLSWEWFFKLKNGEIIGFDPVCYTPRQKKEFIHYIYENTGIEFQNCKGTEEEKKLVKQNCIILAILIILIVAIPTISVLLF